MKTAEEWAATYPPYRNIYAHLRYHPMTEDEIKQIQLDAMKEGMRRAAEIVMPPMREEHEYEQCKEYDQMCKSIGQAILTAAEQLTEKDL